MALILALQAVDPAAVPARASATMTVEQAVHVSSIAPIRLTGEGRLDGPVVIGVAGDPGRAYRLQVQATVAEASGVTRIISAAAGEVEPSAPVATGPSGTDRLRVFGATPLLRRDAEGRTVLPLRIVYE